jgi:hypothetical protein
LDEKRWPLGPKEGGEEESGLESKRRNHLTEIEEKLR